MTFGEKVANRRRDLGLDQKELAKAIDVSFATVSKIEHGRIAPNSKSAKKIAEFLQIDVTLDTVYITGNRNVDLAMLERRVRNAIFELEIIMDNIRSMRGEPYEESL